MRKAKSGTGTLRLIPTTNDLYTGSLQRDKTNGDLYVCSSKNLIRDEYEFIAPFIVSDMDIEENNLVLLPSNEIMIMQPNDMVDYLNSNSSSTKRIVVIPSEFNVGSKLDISDGTLKDGDRVEFEYIGNDTITMSLAHTDPLNIVANYEGLKKQFPIPEHPVKSIYANAATKTLEIVGDSSKIRSIQFNGKEMVTEDIAKDLCKKAIWDYIKNPHELINTSYATGVSCEIKSPKDTNIDAWWSKQKYGK